MFMNCFEKYIYLYFHLEERGEPESLPSPYKEMANALHENSGQELAYLQGKLNLDILCLLMDIVNRGDEEKLLKPSTVIDEQLKIVIELLKEVEKDL